MSNEESYLGPGEDQEAVQILKEEESFDFQSSPVIPIVPENI